MTSLFCVWSARSSATVKLLEDPRPVPAGMSDMLITSRCGAETGTSFKASLTMGCLISSTDRTRSVFEYLIMNSASKVSCRVIYTNLSMAAATTKPECSR